MNRNFNKSGLTLIELLVAISVLTIVTALIIPRLRIVNKERNIRETARLVGSTISSARDRAINGGGGGLVIQRNLNFVTRTGNGNNNRVYFAGTRLMELRATPPYVGDSVDGAAYFFLIRDGDDFFIRGIIPMPLEQDFLKNRQVVRPNDTVVIKGSDYRIAAVYNEFAPDPNEVVFPSGVVEPVLVFDLEYEVSTTTIMVGSPPSPEVVPLINQPDYVTGAPFPPASIPNTPATMDSIDIALADFDVVNDVSVSPFTGGVMLVPIPIEIKRQPRRLQSTVIDLPPGYIIDLRYSGPLDVQLNNAGDTYETSNLTYDDPDTHTVFGLALAANDQTGVNDETALPNQEIVIHFDAKGSLDRMYFNGHSTLLSQSLNFYIDEYDPNEILPGDDADSTAQKLLSSPDNLWVTVGANGGINIGNNTPPAIGSVRQMISDARSISRNRTSAQQ